MTQNLSELSHETFLLPPETLIALRDLSELLELRISLEDNSPLPYREYEKRFRDWKKTPPATIAQKAAYLGVSRGVWAVDPFLRESFARLHPQWTPTGKPGRPEGSSPNRRKQMYRGEVLRRLLDLAGDALRAELSQPAKKAA